MLKRESFSNTSRATRAAMLLPLLLMASCGPAKEAATGAGPHTAAGPLSMHKGLSLVSPPDPGRIVAGQTIYVPAYSSIYISDHAERYDLAITLAVRNTDTTYPIIITSVRYFGTDGELVRRYLEKPVQLAPLASAGFFVAESDSKGGVLSSFIVEWVADHKVSSPITESTMVGVGGTQGVSFTAQGRVIAENDTLAPQEKGRKSGL